MALDEAAVRPPGCVIPLQKPESRHTHRQPDARLHPCCCLWGSDRREGTISRRNKAVILPTRNVPETCYQLGVLLDRLGRHDAAVAVFEHAITLKPKEVSYHQSLGFALESAGRRPEAIRSFKRALELEHVSNNGHAHLRQQG